MRPILYYTRIDLIGGSNDVGVVLPDGSLQVLHSYAHALPYVPTDVLPYNGVLYVSTSSNFPNGTIRKLDSAGNDSAFVTGLNDPETIAVGSDGYLYIVDRTGYGGGGSSPAILRYSTAGVGGFWTDWSAAPHVPSGPWGIAFRDDGSVWTTSFTQYLWQHDATGTFVAEYDASTVSLNLGGLQWKDDLLYIANNAAGGFLTFNPNSSTFTSFPSGSTTEKPEDLALSTRYVYLSSREPANYHIARMNFDGTGYTIIESTNYILGIAPYPLVTPLHIPHKSYAPTTPELVNYATFERWTRLQSQGIDETLHFPFKSYADDQELQNYTAIERWARNQVGSAALHIPHKEWSSDPLELQNYAAIERWSRTLL